MAEHWWILEHLFFSPDGLIVSVGYCCSLCTETSPLLGSALSFWQTCFSVADVNTWSVYSVLSKLGKSIAQAFLKCRWKCILLQSFHAKDNIKIPVGKGQGTFYSCCLGPWSLNLCLLAVCMWAPRFALHCMSPYSPLWTDIEDDIEIKRCGGVGKTLQEGEVLQWRILNIFSHLCFCCWAVPLSCLVIFR